MVRTKGTTPKALQLINQEGVTTTNNGSGESSFRVLYYGDASAGSVPFMWESQPGTPKHLTTEYTLPPLTQPPSYNNNNNNLNQTYNSSKHTTSLQTLFLSKQTQSSTSDSFTSYTSCSTKPTSLRSLFLASSFRSDHVVAPMGNGEGKTEFRRCDGGGGGSTTVMRCFGGGCGLVKAYRMKKVKSALMSIGRHGKIHKN